MIRYTPALAQCLQAPNHRTTGRAQWAMVIYAADGTQLDVIPYDDQGFGYPKWVRELPTLPPVNITAKELRAWLRNRPPANFRMYAPQ